MSKNLGDLLRNSPSAADYYRSLPADTRLELIKRGEEIFSESLLKDAAQEIFHAGGIVSASQKSPGSFHDCS